MARDEAAVVVQSRQPREPEKATETIASSSGGAHLFSRAAVPLMSRRGAGRIINVTSGLGAMVCPGLGAYSISKAGLIHMTKIMAC